MTENIIQPVDGENNQAQATPTSLNRTMVNKAAKFIGAGAAGLGAFWILSSAYTYFYPPAKSKDAIQTNYVINPGGWYMSAGSCSQLKQNTKSIFFQRIQSQLGRPATAADFTGGNRSIYTDIANKQYLIAEQARGKRPIVRPELCVLNYPPQP